MLLVRVRKPADGSLCNYVFSATNVKPTHLYVWDRQKYACMFNLYYAPYSMHAMLVAVVVYLLKLEGV